MGTADGNLAIFEDKSVKVNIEHILHQNLNCFMFIHQHPFVATFTPAAAKASILLFAVPELPAMIAPA